MANTYRALKCSVEITVDNETKLGLIFDEICNRKKLSLINYRFDNKYLLLDSEYLINKRSGSKNVICLTFYIQKYDFFELRQCEYFIWNEQKMFIDVFNLLENTSEYEKVNKVSRIKYN